MPEDYTGWIAILLLLGLVLVVAVWYLLNYQDEKARKRQEEEAAEKARKGREEVAERIRKLGEKRRKHAEEERIKAIFEHEAEWGDVMCHWLVSGQCSLTDNRTAEIMNNFATLGQDTCQRLLQKIIAIGDSSTAVMLALGEPTSVDEQLVTEKEIRSRWVYGVPRKGAKYVWFKNGKVIKIKA
jgi:hypothetical protein